MEIKILGPVRVVNGPDRLEPYREAAALAVLAYVATHPQPVSADELTAALWPLDGDLTIEDGGPRRKTVLNVVSRARAQLGKDEDGQQLLVHETGGYRLASAVTTDWGRFERLTGVASSQAQAGARVFYRRALELVEGAPFGPALSNEFFEWVSSEHLDLMLIARVVDAADELARLALAAADFDMVVWAVEKGLSLDPAREQLYQLWMHALGLSGRGDRVNEIYRRLCSMLQRRIDPAQSPTPASETIWRSYVARGVPSGGAVHREDRSWVERRRGRRILTFGHWHPREGLTRRTYFALLRLRTCHLNLKILRAHELPVRTCALCQLRQSRAPGFVRPRCCSRRAFWAVVEDVISSGVTRRNPRQPPPPCRLSRGPRLAGALDEDMSTTTTWRSCSWRAFSWPLEITAL